MLIMVNWYVDLESFFLCNYTHTHTHTHTYVWASMVAQMVKNLPAMPETQVQSLGREDPLEGGMATHSRILAWRSPRTEEPGGLQCMGSQRIGHDRVTNTFLCTAGCRVEVTGSVSTGIREQR